MKIWNSVYISVCHTLNMNSFETHFHCGLTQFPKEITSVYDKITLYVNMQNCNKSLLILQIFTENEIQSSRNIKRWHHSQFCFKEMARTACELVISTVRSCFKMKSFYRDWCRITMVAGNCVFLACCCLLCLLGV